MVSNPTGGSGRSGTQMRPKEYRNLKPIPATGTFTSDNIHNQQAIFLAPEQMRITQKSNNKNICYDVMPLTVPADLEFPLGAAMKTSQQRAKVYNGWSGSTITDRTCGIYDNLNLCFKKFSINQYTKRKIYNALRLKGSCPSPYHGIVAALDAFADVSVTGLLLEIADRPTKNSFTLGGAIVVCNKGYENQFKLTAGKAKLIRSVSKSQNGMIIKCHLDELLGIALATGLPVVTKSSIYEEMRIDGILSKNNDNNKIRISGPYFESVVDEKIWRESLLQQDEEDKKAAKINTRVVKTAMQITDATSFLKMKNSEKRACLRCSGIKILPRPREGQRALDALMIPLLDEDVAYEVLRRLAETKGDFQQASEMTDHCSRKPELAKQIRLAREAGDRELEEALVQELHEISTLTFDPTEPDNLKAVDGFDIEEWYWESRKELHNFVRYA